MADQQDQQDQPTTPKAQPKSLRTYLSGQGQRSTHGAGVSPQAAKRADGSVIWCQHPNCKGTHTNPARWLVQPKAGKAILTCTTHKKVMERAGAKVTSGLES